MTDPIISELVEAIRNVAPGFVAKCHTIDRLTRAIEALMAPRADPLPTREDRRDYARLRKELTETQEANAKLVMKNVELGGHLSHVRKKADLWRDAAEELERESRAAAAVTDSNWCHGPAQGHPNTVEDYGAEYWYALAVKTGLERDAALARVSELEAELADRITRQDAERRAVWTRIPELERRVELMLAVVEAARSLLVDWFAGFDEGTKVFAVAS